MSIFIPNRSIKLPKDISVPQSLSPSVFETQHRDQAFQMSKRFDGALVDVVSGAKATSVISGVRYGIVNGVVTEFDVNQPPIEDDGLRGCPAFTQLATHTEDLTVWGNINGNVTFVDGYAVKTGDEAGWVAQDVFVPSPPVGTTVFASVSLIGSGVVCINLASKSFALGVEDMADTISGSLLNFVELNPVVPTKLLFRGVVNRDDLYGVSFRLRFSTSPVSFKILGEGAQVTLSLSPMPYVPNNTGSAVSFVSETGSATNGTSFELDDALLSRLKTALRGPNAQGHLELTFKSNIDSGWLAPGDRLNIFSCANNNNIGLRIVHVAANNNAIGVYDGSVPDVWIQYDREIVVGEIFKISLDWGTHSTGQKMRITINGVKSSLVNFSGSFGLQDLLFFFDNKVHAGWIKKDSLKIFDRPRW